MKVKTFPSDVSNIAPRSKIAMNSKVAPYKVDFHCYSAVHKLHHWRAGMGWAGEKITQESLGLLSVSRLNYTGLWVLSSSHVKLLVFFYFKKNHRFGFDRILKSGLISTLDSPDVIF